MKVYLNVVSSRKGTPIPWYGFAGILWSDQQATVYVLDGHITLERVGHELTHPLEGEHHPWWHFCLRSFHGIRTWAHAGKVKITDAGTLIRTGEADV